MLQFREMPFGVDLAIVFSRQEQDGLQQSQ
jgi:hypothetical protein